MRACTLSLQEAKHPDVERSAYSYGAVVHTQSISCTRYPGAEPTKYICEWLPAHTIHVQRAGL